MTRLVRYLLPLVFLCLLGASCSRSDPDQGEVVTTPEKLQPGALGANKATLVIGDLSIKVDLVRKVEGQDIEIHLIAEGEPFEVERYRQTNDGFYLVGRQLGDVKAGGEYFDPPIPLLKFPMRDGATWTWEGSNVSGDIPRKATATIKPEYKPDMVKVVVKLSVDSGAATPATTDLVLWFAPGKGIVRREFGQYSSRIPLEE